MKLSRANWEMIGSKAGWMKDVKEVRVAQMTDDEVLYDQLINFKVVTSAVNEDLQETDEPVLSPSSPYGVRHVPSGHSLDKNYTAIVEGQVKVPQSMLVGDVRDNVEKFLKATLGPKAYLRDAITDLSNDIEDKVFTDSEAEIEIESSDVDLVSFDLVGENIYNVKFRVNVEASGGYGEGVLKGRADDERGEYEGDLARDEGRNYWGD